MMKIISNEINLPKTINVVHPSLAEFLPMVYYYLIVQIVIPPIVELNRHLHLINIVIISNRKVKRNYRPYHLQLFHHRHHRHRIPRRERNSCPDPIISFNNRIFLNNEKPPV